MSALNGWHIGERIVHKRLNHESDSFVMGLFKAVLDHLPEDHAAFHSIRLSFVPIVTLDDTGRPWVSILAGKDGRPGFIQRSAPNILSIDAKLWPGEPLNENAKLFHLNSPMLMAGLGIDFSMRERNKFAGEIMKLEKGGDALHMEFIVKDALGNCPKYINITDLIPYPVTSPIVTSAQLWLYPTDRLPDEVVSFILNSDSTFLGTKYEAPSNEAECYPSHLGMNHRGGRKGFIRVVPSDGRTIVLPDFSGDRIMRSLGNIESTPLASLSFVSFTTGDVLYVTGNATNLYGLDAQRLMPFQNMLTTIYSTGYTLVRDALPVRQRPGTVIDHSPYSPPTRYLAEEVPQTIPFQDVDAISALLVNIHVHSPSIATFTWETSTEISVSPGQAIIMNMTPLLGANEFQYLAPEAPTSVNDDRIRTWTISSMPSTFSRTFSITLREKPSGAATGALFSIIRKIEPKLLQDSRSLMVTACIVGVTGNFVLPEIKTSITSSKLRPVEPQSGSAKSDNLLWVAGGIGITPFLAMLHGLTGGSYSINIILATREPEVLVPLLIAAMHDRAEQLICCSVDVFSTKPIPEINNVNVNGLTVRGHVGRVTAAVFNTPTTADNLEEREIYICGPEPFEEAVVRILEDLGINKAQIRREDFSY